VQNTWIEVKPLRCALRLPDQLTVLFMAMLTSIQHNPVIRMSYQGLVANGKHKKVSLTACIRKMITILNTMLRDQSPWREKYT